MSIWYSATAPARSPARRFWFASPKSADALSALGAAVVAFACATGTARVRAGSVTTAGAGAGEGAGADAGAGAGAGVSAGVAASFFRDSVFVGEAVETSAREGA